MKKELKSVHKRVMGDIQHKTSNKILHSIDWRTCALEHEQEDSIWDEIWTQIRNPIYACEEDLTIP